MIRPHARSLLGLLAAPLLFAQCAPKCAPPPPGPPTIAALAAAPIPLRPGFVKGDDVAFLAESGGLYTRWDPCKDPITYQIDTTVPPTADEEAAIHAAVATASAASGHTFRYMGAIASGTPAAGVDAVIGYRSLSVGNLGSGGGTPNSNLELVTGTAYVQSGMAPDARRLSLIHEIGHLLGLAHVSDPTEVMFGAAVVPYFSVYQAGDLEGMRLVGTSMPCFAAP
jgi:hypothetical protein